MPNELSRETSPYLLQHQDNPVDWVGWGDEAFERAKAEDKMVFLSIGYSTCHWCHVMEHESFESEEVAGVMNENFVCVKVDREERPDVDATYMAFVQATTGQGGWPMSVWLTPDGKPVVGGTYFPPEDRGGRAGFKRMCSEIGRLWKADRERMEESAEKVMAHLREQSTAGAVVSGLADSKVFGDFVDRCESMFDPEWGGWGGAPKFPRPVVPRLLLQLADRFGGEEGEACLQMVDRTMRTMAAGGMHDQLAGGFHRYSVDRYWHVPHYEKMLYDQGQLALLYLEAWQVSKDVRDREVAEGIFGYVLRDLKDAGGAFHAAEDADSLPPEGGTKRREGAFWTWKSKEIYELLDPKAAGLFCAAFGVQEDGNARPESDPHQELVGENTLFRASSDGMLAEQFGMSEKEVAEALEKASEVMLEARMKRPMPHRDDKIVTAWNGLMVATLAKGGRVLGREDLVEAAGMALRFVKMELWDGEVLWRSYRERRGTVPGFASDYAFLISGLIEMHAAEPEGGWLDWSRDLQAALDRAWWSEERAGYILRPELAGEVLMEIREDYDGAEPAANHVAAENLLKLAVLCDDPDFALRAEAILRAGSRTMEKQSHACPVLLGALDLKERGVMKVQVRGELDEDLAVSLREKYLPRAVFVKEGGPLRRPAGYEGQAGEVIVCEGEVCRKWE